MNGSFLRGGGPAPSLAVTLRLAAIALVLGPAGCATTYAYRFEPTGGAAHGDDGSGSNSYESADLKATARLTDGVVVFALTNKTDDVVQVRWNQITLDRGDGSVSAPRPEVDLGWVAAGATMTARLVPFVLPRSGDAAAAYGERRLVLTVPLVVRHEATVVSFQFLAHVKAL